MLSHLNAFYTFYFTKIKEDISYQHFNNDLKIPFITGKKYNYKIVNHNVS